MLTYCCSSSSKAVTINWLADVSCNGRTPLTVSAASSALSSVRTCKIVVSRSKISVPSSMKIANVDERTRRRLEVRIWSGVRTEIPRVYHCRPFLNRFVLERCRKEVVRLSMFLGFEYGVFESLAESTP